MKFLFLIVTLSFFSTTTLAAGSDPAINGNTTPARPSKCPVLESEEGDDYLHDVENGRCHNSIVASSPDGISVEPVEEEGGVYSIKVFSTRDCTGQPAAVGVNSLSLNGQTSVASMLVTC